MATSQRATLKARARVKTAAKERVGLHPQVRITARARAKPAKEKTPARNLAATCATGRATGPGSAA